jgi:hypothetical protein
MWFGMALALATPAMPGMASGRNQEPTPSTKDETVTIVGCLVEGNPAAATGQTSPASPATNAGYFVQTKAIQVPVGTTVAVGGSGAAPGTAGGATTSAGTPDKTTLYQVTGLNREQLRPHVGHRVELTGRLSHDTTPGANTQAKTTVDANGRATTRVESRMDVSGVLRATAITMVSASCQ